MDNFDNILKNHIKNDRLNTKPSNAVLNHLHNQMLLNSANSRTQQNSFIPPFSSLIGKKNIGWKISIAAVLLISFMGLKQINQNNLYFQSADSTQLHQNLDTLNFQLVDSSFTY